VRKSSIIAFVCFWWLCGVLTLQAASASVDYWEVQTTAVEGSGQSGLVNALVAPGQDTTAVLQSVTALRIVGTLNGTDCLALRNKMPNLEHLDMAGVDFVEGGIAYYGNNMTQPGVFPTYLFSQCVAATNLTSVILPNSVTLIDKCAFMSCSQLESVEFGSQTENIDKQAFRDCVQLTNVTFPPSLTRIGDECFYGCKLITAVILPENLATLSDKCFQNCTGITQLTLNESLTKIGNSCFYGCSKLTSIVFNENLLEIGSSAFTNCSILADVLLPNTVTKLGNTAFSNCKKLTSFRLPLQLITLGNNVFSGCNALRELHAPILNPISISSESFDQTLRKNITLYVPTLTYYAYFWSNGWGAFQHISCENIDYQDAINLKSTAILDTNMPGAAYGDNVIGQSPDLLTIYPTGSLTVENSVSQCFNVVELNSDALSHPALINAGDLRVNTLRYKFPLKKGEWRLVAFPRPVNKRNIGLPNGSSIYVYNGATRATGASGWSQFTGNILEAGKGYAIYVSADVTLSCETTSNPVKENDVKFTLNANSASQTADAGWNLFGNPYLSYYSINDLGITDPVVVYNGKMGTYETYYPGEDEYRLAPYQAFFVKRSSNDAVRLKREKRQIYSLGCNESTPRQSCSAVADSGTPPEPAIINLVSVTCEPADAATMEGEGYYAQGSIAHIKVNAAAGYQLDKWILNGTECSVRSNSIDYVVGTSNAHFVACMKERTDEVDPGYNPDMPDDPDQQETVAAKVLLKIKMSPANTAVIKVDGSTLDATGEVWVDAGSVVTIKCIPNKNFDFAGWRQVGMGTLLSEEAEIDYMMPSRSATLLASMEYSPADPTDPTTSPEDTQEEIDNGQGVRLGDINEDGAVDISDAVELVELLKDPITNSARLILLRCDVNGDLVVDDKDVSAIVNTICLNENYLFSIADTLARQDTVTDRLSIAPITVEPGGAYVNLQVSLSSTQNYTAYAFDLLLPDGIEVDTVQLNHPSSGHLFRYNLFQEDKLVLRVACFSINNQVLPANLAFALKLPLSAVPYTYPENLQVGIRHAMLVSPAAKAFVPQCEPEEIEISHHSYVPVLISSENMYNTLVLPFSAILPDGLRAAECLNANDTCMYLTEVDSLEAFVPYIVYAENGINYTFEGNYITDPEQNYATVVTKGYLTGVLIQTMIREGYVLQNHGSGASFYLVDRTVALPAGKAYLLRPEASSNSISFRFSNSHDDNILSIASPIEVLPDDKPIYYNMRGIQEEHPSKGLYLKSGKIYYIR